MFIALRDLRFARGRFALLGGVIALMTLMVVLLSGLAAGLASASVSAVNALPADKIAFQDPGAEQDVSFSNSILSADAPADFAAESGVTGAHPLGVSNGRLETGDETSAAVTVLGTDQRLFPERMEGTALEAGEIAVTAELADENGVTVGDATQISGQDAKVAAIVDSTTFNHLPVVYTPIDTWHDLSHSEDITAVAMTVEADSDPGVDGTATVTREDAFNAVGGYASEQGSLSMMRGLLLAISALIVGAFFTVWTMQRAADLAVVRAIGGSRGYLLRDALSQAGILLVVGTAVGAGAAAGIGALAATVMPFVLDASTLALPLAATIGVGVVGAAFAVRRVSTVDPLTALGAAR